MPSKTFDLPEIGQVTITKRKNNRNIRLSFTANGQIRVSLPYYAPYHAGLNFARSKHTWIAKHQPAQPELLVQNQIIAKKYRLDFRSNSSAVKPAVRVRQGLVVVTHNNNQATISNEVQAAARRGVIRALKNEAENILPQRLDKIANLYGYRYRSVKIKPLKTRWGSCDQDGNIKLNLYLILLEPELIDYVILHELVHTRFQHHQADFWQEMRCHMPDVDKLKKRARASRPGL